MNGSFTWRRCHARNGLSEGQLRHDHASGHAWKSASKYGTHKWKEERGGNVGRTEERTEEMGKKEAEREKGSLLRSGARN